MNCKIPFTKDIPFEKKLYEITSISLEHELKVENELLKGNFIISGDFKSHEVSINKEAFSYILPFEISLSENIDEQSLEFMIEDFTYEVLANNILRVNIDFNVIGSVKEEEPKLERDFIKPDGIPLINKEPKEVPDECLTKPLTTPLEDIDLIKNTREPNMNLPEENETNIPEVNEKVIANNEKIISNPDANTLKEVKEENDIIIESVKPDALNPETTILNEVKTSSNDFATYHIHLVSDGETIETICTMYNSNMNILSEYNEISNLNPGDKLIIPEQNE